MTVPTWPSELPRPERSSWQRSRQDSRLKRNAETGAPGYRRRFSSAASHVGLSVLLDRNRKAVFDQFYDDTTKDGSLPFYMPDPTTDGWKLFAADGRPILLSKRWLCLFGDDMPAETIIGIEFRMSFSVWVMP